MKPKILKLNIPEPLPKDFDPLLGRSVGDYLRALNRTPSDEVKHSEGSVFDDPDFDFSFRESAPVQPVLEDDIVENTPAEITPFETMDGQANEAIDEAIIEDNLSEKWTFEDEAQAKEVHIEEAYEIATQVEIEQEIVETQTIEIQEIETQEVEIAPVENIVEQDIPQAQPTQILETEDLIEQPFVQEEIPEVIEETQIESTSLETSIICLLYTSRCV